MGENESQRWAERVIAVERERDEARAEAARWKAEAERLREALAFYADEQNYHDGIPGEWVTYPGHPGSYTGFSETEFEEDHGERARAALSAGGGTDA